ncbi:dTDP-3-amino-3,4,6-trideoxy-alpha-D-glucopyranose [Poriferisphaera corsica]|uniref:dTDP-3-amino-3,4, 6-trideoxy-alpha-D-glucopyranose n=1 Tax=Poriferisphaera corsica TaxID=2528020 RepID=A0A517YXL5_9BACT|nr:class I SAM-dependent methyltransferase [Poriferisphaera corsica]QDU34975.1 dTDP-3-amino-3,4,6-trideoxy-alpha-D-glucopyranose [Poriferisphaera corsica]
MCSNPEHHQQRDKPTHNRLYHDLAYLWPLLSPPDNYIAETSILQQVIEDKLSGQVKAADEAGEQLLITELGAGGGHALFHLRDHFKCTAVDISEDMLHHCKHLNPGVICVATDMRNVSLEEKQDVILIHDSIDYLTTEEDILLTFENARKNLKPHGLLIVAPTYTTETFESGESATDHQSSRELDVTYTTRVIDPDTDDDLFEMHLEYHITDLRTNFATVEHDIHLCGLFSIAAWASLLSRSGFDPELFEQTEETAWTLFAATLT